MRTRGTMTTAAAGAPDREGERLRLRLSPGEVSYPRKAVQAVLADQHGDRDHAGRTGLASGGEQDGRHGLYLAQKSSVAVQLANKGSLLLDNARALYGCVHLSGIAD